MQSPLGRKLLFLPPILIGAGILALVVTTKKPPKQLPATEISTDVRVLTTQKLSVIPRVLGYGTVQPSRVWNAVAQVAGRLEQVHPDFKKGAVLKAGTQIARISPADYEIAIAQAKANIRSSDAKIKELTLTISNTQGTLEIERKTLRINELEYERKRKLVSRGVISNAVKDQEQRALLGQRKRVLELQNILRLLPIQIIAQQELRAVSMAQLSAAELNLKRTRITLPFDARIASSNIEVTQFVAVGKVLGVADAMQGAEIDAQVPPRHLRAMFKAAAMGEPPPLGGIKTDSVEKLAIKLGLYAIVRIGNIGQTVEWRARVVRISDTMDPKTRTVGVIVAVDDPYKNVVPGVRPPLIKGMFVEVEIRSKQIKDQIVIPRAALHGRRIFIVDKDNRLDFRDVRPSLLQGDFAVISSGLKAGTKIVISDLIPAIKGMLLRPIADRDLPQRLKDQALAKGPMR